MSAVSCTKSVKKALAAFLKAQMPSIRQAYDDFPTPNQDLDMPCLSVFQKNPSYGPCMPYEIYKGPILPNNTAIIRRVVGFWDFSMQVDLWAPTKVQRDELMEELVLAFNVGRVPGINLKMADYFDMYATFTFSKVETFEDSAASQRGEWRAVATMLAQSRAVVETTEAIMTVIENNLTVVDNIPAEE